MRRFKLFEFNDLKWWPSILRSMTTDFLQAALEKDKPYLPKIDLIAKAIIASKSNQIVDMCSGSLGPWKHLKNEINKITNKSIHITFTDKYPNKEIADKLKNDSDFTYLNKAIDAKNISTSLGHTRTMFNGFHHFNEEDSQEILNNTVKNKQSIIIFELLRRSWADVVLVAFFMPIFIIVTMPFLLKISFRNILFTYIVPIFPVTFTWDSIVSNLRSFNKEELDHMMKKADIHNEYVWYTDRYRHNSLPVLYLIAYPK